MQPPYPQIKLKSLSIGTLKSDLSLINLLIMDPKTLYGSKTEKGFKYISINDHYKSKKRLGSIEFLLKANNKLSKKFVKKHQIVPRQTPSIVKNIQFNEKNLEMKFNYKGWITRVFDDKGYLTEPSGILINKPVRIKFKTFKDFDIVREFVTN